MTVIGKIDPVQRPAQGPANSEEGPMDSGLRALTAVARHYQLDWSMTRLSHVYAKPQEHDGRELVRIAKAEGMKAQLQAMTWAQLSKLQKMTPFLVRMDNGAWFVVLKVGKDAQMWGSDGKTPGPD